MRRHLLGWSAVFICVGLGLLGFLLFVVAVFAEFVATRETPMTVTSILTPTIQIALAGLFLFAFMVVLGFVLVMFLLARQTRKLAPGYGEAYYHMQNLQFGSAISMLERAITTGRETSELLAMLTSAYAHDGQYGKAQATADRAIRLFPDDPSAYITLANGYRLQASYEEAAQALEQATQLAPEHPISWAELGFVERLAGDDDAAFAAFRRAAAFRLPAMYSVRVYYHLWQAYRERGDADAAATASAKMISACDGLDGWRPLQRAMEGTAYGQSLRYELAAIEQAITEADATILG